MRRLSVAKISRSWLVQTRGNDSDNAERIRAPRRRDQATESRPTHELASDDTASFCLELGDRRDHYVIRSQPCAGLYLQFITVAEGVIVRS
jgi:hypothetical protein